MKPANCGHEMCERKCRDLIWSRIRWDLWYCDPREWRSSGRAANRHSRYRCPSQRSATAAAAATSESSRSARNTRATDLLLLLFLQVEVLSVGPNRSCLAAPRIPICIFLSNFFGRTGILEGTCRAATGTAILCQCSGLRASTTFLRAAEIDLRSVNSPVCLSRVPVNLNFTFGLRDSLILSLSIMNLFSFSYFPCAFNLLIAIVRNQKSYFPIFFLIRFWWD